MKRFLLYAILLVSSGNLCSQGTPNTAFPSLNLRPAARLAGLGTGFASFYEPNIAAAMANSSLITKELHNFAAINYADYFSAYSDIHATYIYDFQDIGTFLASLQYVNYGEVDSYDELQNYLGQSNLAYDAILNIGWGKTLDSVFSIGANFKYLFSRGENFYMSGIAVDLSGSYVNAAERWAVSFAFRNIGTVLKQSMFNEYDKLPFEITLAGYKRLQHAPFAFSLVLSNLQKWNLSGVDIHEVKVDPLTNEETKVNKLSAIADNAMRHIVLGFEFLPLKRFTFRMGYNYHYRQEMRIESRPGFVGFSWGIGLSIYKFQVDYARSAHHLAGAPNYISVSTNLSNFNL